MIDQTFKAIAEAGALETVIRLVHRGMERRPVWTVSLQRLDNHLQLGQGDGETPAEAIANAMENQRRRYERPALVLRG